MHQRLSAVVVVPASVRSRYVVHFHYVHASSVRYSQVSCVTPMSCDLCDVSLN